MLSCKMNWSGFYIYSLASTAMVDPKAETERLESHCCTKFSDLEVGKIAGCARRGCINSADQT
jgi:hypothetical protein